MKRVFTLFLQILLCLSVSAHLAAQCNQELCPGVPPPGLCAEDACIMCDPCLLSGYTGSTVPGSNACDVPGPFCGTIENNQWFAFLAPPSGTVTFNFNVFNCVQNQGIQAEIYSTNSCNDFVSVSNCWSPGAATQGSVTASGLSPYCTYYLMIDGFAGDFCEYTITTTDCMVPPNPGPLSVVGPTEVCPGATVTYSMVPPPTESCGNNSNEIQWFGIEPNGVIVGPNDQPTVTVQWLSIGVATITASYNNVCFGGNISSPVIVSIQPIPPTFEELDACLGDCVPCAGQLVCTPGVTPVVLTSWLGCDSLVNCVINPIFPVFNDLGEVTICAPQTFNICGNTFTECGPIAQTCENWQGCDSTVIVDLAILNPKAILAQPGVLDCTPGSSIVIDGTASTVASECHVNATTAYSWTGPAGGISGPANGPTVNATQPGQYCLTVTHARGGVSCSETKCVTVIKDDDLPQTPQVNGPANPCALDTVLYTVSPVGQPAPTGYTWTTSNGTPVSQVDSTSVSVSWPGSGTFQICATADNDCGSSNQACLTVVVATAPTATLSGGGLVCTGSGDSVALTLTLTGISPWSVGYEINGQAQPPLTITTSPFTLLASEIGTYLLTGIVGGAGCPGSVSGTATIAEFDVPTAILSGTQSICQGSGQTAALSVTLTGAAPWTVSWAVNGNPQAPFTATDSLHTLSVGQAQAGSISLLSVVDANGCEGSVSGTGTVTVNTAPTVSNITTSCDPTNTNYSVSFTINGGTPPYSVTPNTGSLNGNIFTSNPLLSGTGYSFVVDDANGCNPLTVSDDIVICDCDTKAGSMDLSPLEVCGEGPVTAVYDPASQVFDGNDTLAFVLHLGNGVNIVPPILGTFPTPEISFLPGSMDYGTTYYLSAVVGDDNGSGSVNLSDPCLDVSQGTPITFYEVPTATLSGNPIVCAGTPASLSVAFTGVGPWSVTYETTAGQQTVNGITNNPYTLTINAAASTPVSLLTMQDDNCPGSVSGSATVTVNTAVNASAETICDLGGTFYTVQLTITGGDPGSYSVSPATGTLTGNVFVSDPITAGEGYLFTVTDANGCAPKTLQQTEVFCDCTTDVGVMVGPPLTVCGTGPVTAVYDLTEQVLDPDDIRVFILHTNSGTNPGTVLATQQDDPTFGFNPANMSYGVTYYISAAVGNGLPTGTVDLSDPCLQVAQGTPVTFYEIPTATLAGSTALCLGASTELTISLTGEQPFQFSINGEDLSGITTTDLTYSVTPGLTTSYELLNFQDENCPGTVDGQAVVQVNTAPVISNGTSACDPDTNTYTVVFSITGGDPASYAVSPPNTGSLSNGVFTSNNIPSDVFHTFIVSDANGCGSDTISGVLDCNCETFAGTMPAGPLDACLNEGIAIFGGSTGEVLDPDDVLWYYLHTGSGASLGTVLAVNSQAGFNFNPNTMQAGTTYYISAVAANNDGTGAVDLTDFCLSVAPGTPVVWNPLPDVSLVASDAVCEGAAAQVVFSMDGVGPYNISYAVNGTPTSSSNITSPFTLALNPTIQTVIQMIAVTDLGAGCATPTAAADTILVSAAVDAGIPTAPLSFCEGDDAMVDLATLLSGADPDGSWLTAAGAAVPNGMVNTNSLPVGANTFTYTVSASPPCTDDQSAVVVAVSPSPVANAGQDQGLNCDLASVTLGSTSQPGLSYQWSGGVDNPGVANPSTSSPGTYTLVVTDNLSGCSATDAVTVSQIVTLPEPHITVSGVSCFGDQDGFILVDSITNGLPPYLCAFNGGPFSTQKQFTNLSPGEYTLEIVDAAGCERTVTFEVAEPSLVDVSIVMVSEGDDNIISLGDSALLTIDVSPAFDSLDAVVWTPEDAVPCPTCPENWVTPTTQTTFSVTVDKDGCQDSDNLTVFVRKDRPVFVPNAFSPNNDGVNDLFQLYAGPQVLRIKSFLVFNRWGETVFQSFGFEPNDPAVYWDGLYRGKPLDPGVFTWFAEIEFVDGRLQLYEGDLTLVR
ncbi:MAG: gliding motility protein SprB [Bacteroidota bacterium]